MSGFGSGYGTNIPFGSSNFGQPSSSNNPFGSTATPSFPFSNQTAMNMSAGTSGFGSPTVPVPFGQTTAQYNSAMTFGTSPNIMAPTTAFGVNPTGFGINSGTSSSGTTAPFGTPNPSQSHSTNTFGSTWGQPQFSSSLNPQAPPFASATFPTVNTNPFGVGSSTVTSNSTSFTAPFGTSSTTSSAWKPASTSSYSNTDDQSMSPTRTSPLPMADDGGEYSHALSKRRSNLPFGPPPTTTSVDHVGMTPFGLSSTLSKSPFTSANQSSSLTDQQASQTQQGSSSSTAQEELARLKAKKERLMKKLEEKKRREQAENNTTTRLSPVLEVGGQDSESLSLVKSTGGDELAQRNASRFGTNMATTSATRALMPKELLPEALNATSDYSALRVDRQNETRETLETAVSLVGTCPHMCPDEELLRREREGDIQLLETPLPGQLHPDHWTLRDTMVKRFRRSAADYKLDVPEWVRPPEVLERVIGYLEEWVMERDRQGPDPRFPNQGTPPSLDVYQFIWDRTRMIRKDFTLQNYVGTGGKCDARAVRCHERICRWHILSEHQLSHIPDFVNMQSQQNIQELGQTMKTLNQYYDDYLGRAYVEVPDVEGSETKTDLTGYSFGCAATKVQGPNPVDFDGSPLDNESGSTELLIQPGVADKDPNHGTSEAEMRGLYILLTIDNDGGMEVLKYAARLFRDRPKIYHSHPIQLALAVYKAKKEYNYARFFSIIRDPSTPYLFACIMFKYVETMRRVAFKIFSKTYGGRAKDNNEPIYDAYPLKTLARVLCFEDLDEARNACVHYNITVKDEEISTSSGPRMEEIIHWRLTSFKKPKDISKGTIIPLKPRKMVRIIEKKVNGATRLAICRGRLSVSSEVTKERQLTSDACQQVEQHKAANLIIMEAEQRKKEQQEQERLQKQAIVERNKQLREERRQLELQKQLEREAQLQRERESRLKQAEEERKIQLEREAAIQLEIEMKKKEEAARQMAEEEERKRRDAAEALRRAQEEEAIRIRDAKEKERLEQVKIQQERELAERQRQEEVERELRRLDELRKLQEEREQKIREQEVAEKNAERERLEMTAMQAYNKWKCFAASTRKEIIIKRWLRRIPRRFIAVDMKSNYGVGESMCTDVFEHPKYDANLGTAPDVSTNCRQIFESLLLDRSPFQMSAIMSSGMVETELENDKHPYSRTLLFKVQVAFTTCKDLALADLARLYFRCRLQFGKIHFVHLMSTVVRVVFVEYNPVESNPVHDAVLLIVPRPLEAEGMSGLLATEPQKPCFVQLMTESSSDIKQLGTTFRMLLRGKFKFVEIKSTLMNGAIREIEAGIYSHMTEVMTRLLTISCPIVERISMEKLCWLCINSVLWLSSAVHSRDDVVESARFAYEYLLESVESTLGSRVVNWPASEFSVNGVIPDYFSEGEHLPVEWSTIRRTARDNLDQFSWLLDETLTLPEVLSKLLVDAPVEVQSQCYDLLDHRCFRRSLQGALLWRIRRDEGYLGTDDYIYGPVGFVKELLHVTSLQFRNSQPSLRKPPFRSRAREVIIPNVEDIAGQICTGEELLALTNGQQSVGDASLVDIPSHPMPGEEIRDSAVISARKRGRQESTRISPATPMRSEILIDSDAYTKKLRALVGGQPGRDMIVGRSTLGSLLRKASNLPSG